MRKLFVAAAVLGAGFALGVVVVGIPIAVRAGVGGNGAVVNGDTNGDGELDVSDAIFLLVHLFKGGAPPAACADSPDLLGRVATLESQIVSLEQTDASALQEIERIGERVERAEPASPLICVNLLAARELPCSTNPEYLRGPGIFEPQGTNTTISRGVLVRDDGSQEGPANSIRFDTDHESSLLLELDYSSLYAYSPGPAGVGLKVDVDPEWQVGFSLSSNPGTARKVMLAVPAGPHSLTVTGGCVCSLRDDCGTLLDLQYLSIRYLD